MPCEQSSIYGGCKWLSSRPSLAGTRSLVAALLEYSLTSELQKGEKYQEETEEGWEDSSQQGIRWSRCSRQAEAAAGQAEVYRLLSCQEGPSLCGCLETILGI